MNEFGLPFSVPLVRILTFSPHFILLKIDIRPVALQPQAIHIPAFCDFHELAQPSPLSISTQFYTCAAFHSY
jgi:hypothetical protein